MGWLFNVDASAGTWHRGNGCIFITARLGFRSQRMGGRDDICLRFRYSYTSRRVRRSFLGRNLYLCSHLGACWFPLAFEVLLTLFML